MEGKNTLSNAEKAAANAANNFTGTVTATVTEVLPSGYLRVRGEKQVAFDRGTEFIRFSGVVNPLALSNNTVASTSIADMRVEYRSNSSFDKAALQSALARFFLSVLPL
jgi:flagellar L-ring protein precursor FlgH